MAKNFRRLAAVREEILRGKRSTHSGELRCQEENRLPDMLPGPELQIAAFALDLTERKRAENQVRSQLEELQRWQNVMLDREDRVQALKREVNELCRRAGEPARYPSQASDSVAGATGKPAS